MDEYVNIIWYDENFSVITQDILDTIHYRVFLCTNIDSLLKTINDDVHDTEKILLVLSGIMDHELILSTVHNKGRIVSIFILVDALHITFELYNKICGVFTDYETLEKTMLAKARILNHQAIAFDFDEKLTETSMEELTAKPEVSLFDAHSRFSSTRFVTQDEKQKLLKYCRERYSSNPTQLRLIDKFERTYESSHALRWYSKDCFLFASLNKCMRKQSGNVYDCDMVYFAVDLSMQIQLEWKKQREAKYVSLQSFHVYRGLNLPETEIIRIQNYRGKSITTKGFLSTTKSIDVARMFTANVVFDIEIDPKLENVIYADITSYSQIPDEEEILIDFGTSFKVVDIILDPLDNWWTVQLVTVNETDKVIDSYIDVKRSQQEDDVMIATSLVFFGHTERACRLLRDSLMNSTNNNMQKFELNCALGEIYAQSGKFVLAADYLQEAYHLGNSFDPYSLRLYSVTFWLAMMYACSNKHDRAFDYLAIELEFPDPEPYSLPRTCARSWTYLVTNEESLSFDTYRGAYEHLQRCLTLYQQNEDICYRIHFYIGLILLKCNREEITADSLDEALLHLKISGHGASDKSTNFLMLYYYHIGVIYESKECYNKAKYYYRKILPILRCNCDQSENLIMIHVRIASCYAVQNMYTLAIQRYRRALQQSLVSGNQILIGKVRAHLGVTYLAANQYYEAIEQFICITLLLDVIARPFIQEIYLIIAETLLKVNDILNAVKYYSKYLDRYEEVDDVDCQLWCSTCERIVDKYISENQFDYSILYAKKLLEFRMKKCPDYFQEILEAQLRIGLCYRKSSEWQEAINYYKIAYDIMEKHTTDLSTEEYNPLVSDQAVIIQSTLSTLYQKIHDYDQAMYHANIALQTEEKLVSRDRITIASFYDIIGWCYYKKGDYDNALTFCTKGLHLLHTYTSEWDVRCCTMYHSLGAIWLELGDLKQSFSYCEKSLIILAHSLEFEGKKNILTDCFSLLDYICKRENNISQTFTSPKNLSNTLKIRQDLERSLQQFP
jgi:tetratricopeptide (TPR) repeat protein